MNDLTTSWFSGVKPDEGKGTPEGPALSWENVVIAPRAPELAAAIHPVSESQTRIFPSTKFLSKQDSSQDLRHWTWHAQF